MDNEKQIEITVVIPCYNGEVTLAETLDGLVAQQWDGVWEILLSDNRSTDRSVAIFREYAVGNPHIPMRVVDASQRKGQPHALNTGVYSAKGLSVLFCDADDVPAPGWLSAMATALREYDFVASRMDLRTLNSDWVFQSRRNAQESELPKISYPPYLYHAGGGTVGFRKKVFETVGEFDHSLPCLHDTDFCFRAQQAGYQIHYEADAVMCIRFRADMDAIYRQAYNYAKYNVIVSKRYKAHGPPPKGRWGRFIKAWRSLWRTYRRPGKDMAEMARFQWKLGWQMGLLAGILQNRCPPP